jgi:hypothetical protein
MPMWLSAFSMPRLPFDAEGARTAIARDRLHRRRPTLAKASPPIKLRPGGRPHELD